MQNLNVLLDYGCLTTETFGSAKVSINIAFIFIYGVGQNFPYSTCLEKIFSAIELSDGAKRGINIPKENIWKSEKQIR